MSSILRATGTNFDPDAYLANGGLKADRVYRKGEPRFRSKPEGRRHENSGLTVVASGADMDEFERQVAESIAFLRDHGAEIARLRDFTGVEELWLDFGIHLRDAFLQCDYLPPELVRLAGELGIGIELSHYQGYERPVGSRLSRAFTFAARQVRGTVERSPDFFPIYTENGKWRHGGELWTDWCAGFHAGMMWIIARRTGDPWWRATAEHYSRLIEHKKFDRDVHDLGFIFLNTYLPWYELTGDPRLNEVLITAGRTLALRFNPRGKYLRSFVAPESLFIDIMMNVPIIFYAARETGDQDLYDLAVAHCRTTEKCLVRPDGGTVHEGIFNPETGEFLRESTHQGLRPDSDWTRGLAWSLYGFGTVYTYTNDPADLAVAERNADHFLDRCGIGTVPPWDFDVPEGPDRIDDSSAGAIAASGLWNLSKLARDPARADRYREGALALLDSLCTGHYVAWEDDGWEGVLKHGVYHFHKKLGVDESVMWGDFFFLEAVTKVIAAAEAGAIDIDH